MQRYADSPGCGTAERSGEIKYNIFVSGGTSSGKTTLLNALGQFIGAEERVIVIEDSAELKLNYIENLVQMECRQANTMGKGKINMSDLIKSSLRMRPDRIIVGEVRGKEVLDMIQAMKHRTFGQHEYRTRKFYRRNAQEAGDYVFDGDTA